MFPRRSSRWEEGRWRPAPSLLDQATCGSALFAKAGIEVVDALPVTCMSRLLAPGTTHDFM